MHAPLPNHSLAVDMPRPRRDGWLLAPFGRVFHKLLDRIDGALVWGRLEATLPDGTSRVLGGAAAGPVAIVDLRSWRALVRLVTGGSAGWYEAWAKGEWASPDAVQLFDLFMRNRLTLGGTARAHGVTRMTRRALHAMRRNDRRGAARNIAFHYNLGNDFYALWLDPSMTYSSALFAEPVSAAEALEAAQLRKIDALLDRIPADKRGALLEIGCGWGGCAMRAAERGFGPVTAITISAEQQAYARDQVAGRGLSDRCAIELIDYRDVQGQYDAVVSVEMVEAVGQEYWPAYLDIISRALTPGGVAALQYIAIDDAIFERYAASSDFVQTYVFPGGMLLSEDRFRALAEERGLRWDKRVGLGAHYAETLRRWRSAFDLAVVQGRLPAKFDPKFIDLWRYYLMYCEGGFRGRGIDAAQVTLVKEG